MTELIEELIEVLKPEESTKEGVLEEINTLLDVEEEKRVFENKVEKRDEVILRRLQKLENEMLDIRRIIQSS